MMGMALLLSAGVAFADTFECFANRACIGTDGPDTLNGSTGSDSMDARQDDDELFGNEGHDFMSGDAFAAPNNDTSTDGNDLVTGGPGFDDMVGYGGGDELLGGANGDFIFAEESSANKGEDIVKGGRGNDFIQAIDETKDTISCGKGKNDVAFFDEGIDTVANNCEHKNPDFEELSSSAASSTPAKVSAERVNALRAR
jgi:Ca2+-binding RTX toxin-like protein